MNKGIIIAAAMAMTSDFANAWSINGHMIVANVAQNVLQASDVNSWNAANTLLSYLKAYDPTLTSHEDQHPFIECSTFADDIKYNGGAWQSDFHYVDETYVD